MINHDEMCAADAPSAEARIDRIAAALYEEMYNRSWGKLEEWAKPQWRKQARVAADADDNYCAAFAQARADAAVARERERLAALLEQVADEQDDSDIGERASDAFNYGNRRSMSERLQSWNKVIADAIRSGEQP